jgi:hypothetical protein
MLITGSFYGLTKVESISGLQFQKFRKTTFLVHLRPEQIDHQTPELNDCCLVLYVKCNPTDQM